MEDPGQPQSSEQPIKQPIAQLSSIEQNKESSLKYQIVGTINVQIGFLFIFIITPIIFIIPYFSMMPPNRNLYYFSISFFLIVGIINFFIGINLLRKSTKNKNKFFRYSLLLIIIQFLLIFSFLKTPILSVIFPEPKNNFAIPDLLSDIPTPTPISTDPTASPDQIGADWKTYTNDEYVFEIKYPPAFKLVQDRSGITLLTNSPPNIIGTCQDFIFTINFSEADLQITPEFYKVSIDGKAGRRLDKKYALEGKNCISSSIRISINQPKTKYLHISMTRQEDKYKETFDQILSTFRFAN
ncbi:MAG: hypothetical protein Q7K55_04520 [Candidatus Levybacteria bacterium]|nr:hypothetical protein [Candidatus Levybacteria bacterium]